MRLSGHEINSQLRQKLEMPTGRHLYVILGTYARLERYERVDFREARSPANEKLAPAVNINHALLARVADEELKRLVQTEASRLESVRDRLAKELDTFVADRLEASSLLTLKNNLKFSECLSMELAAELFATRFTDELATEQVFSEVRRTVIAT